MILFPAIDLYEGKVVRLTKGDYRAMKIYSDDPAGMARKLEEAGASWLHLVDLEGARDGGTPNFPVIREICQSVSIPLEVGGGIRDFSTMEKYLGIGVERLILGTKALTDESFLIEALRNFGTHVAVSVDSKDGKPAIHGWTEVLDMDMFSFLDRISGLGCATAIVTDISRDGALRGTNLSLYRELLRISGLNITASGGVSSYEDIKSLREMGLYGAILGKAMYEGAVTLSEAVQIAEG